jgi:hypothetical protein
MKLGWFVLPLCVLGLADCVQDTNIAPQYARYSGCPLDKVEVDRGQGEYRASGCGNSLKFWCRHDFQCKSPLIVVAERHAKQFSCSPKAALVEELGEDTYIARGCGQTVTYVCFWDPTHAARCVVETTEYKRHAD